MRLAEHHREAASPAIVWEDSACLLCGSANAMPVYEAADRIGAGLRFLIVKCNRCELYFTNPRPDLVSIQQFYPDDYPCHHAKDRANKTMQWLPMHGNARLLDFGCGAGDFLRRMQTLGWNVTGLDTAAPAVERARELGLPAFLGTLPHPFWTDACFDAITMRQSLEHVHQPLDVLRGAHRLLTTGGRLLVTVPNFDSFASRWFRSDWYGLDVPRHLTHFTPDTLHKMLMHAGFEDSEIRQQQHTSWIRHSARRTGGGFLALRLGSTLAGGWGRLCGRAESILAIAIKR